MAVSLKAHDTTTRNEWVDALQKCNRASRVAHESAQVCHARGRHQQLSPSLSLVAEARWAAAPSCCATGEREARDAGQGERGLADARGAVLPVDNPLSFARGPAAPSARRCACAVWAHRVLLCTAGRCVCDTCHRARATSYYYVTSVSQCQNWHKCECCCHNGAATADNRASRSARCSRSTACLEKAAVPRSMPCGTEARVSAPP